MHYRDITKAAVEQGLLVSDGKTPEATLAAQVGTDIKRRKEQGELPLFTREGRGIIGLAEWGPKGLSVQIERNNLRVRRELHDYLMKMPPAEFEKLIAALLRKLDFVDVTPTPPSGDGGIDTRGTLVVVDSINVRMAVQVKRWKANVRSPTVQQVRGSLGAHEQGLIVTTGNFSEGARAEAQRSDASPVALIDGQQLLNLLITHQLLVRKIEQPTLLELHTDIEEVGDALLDGGETAAAP